MESNIKGILPKLGLTTIRAVSAGAGGGVTSSGLHEKSNAPIMK
jgi:hypothetical protein